MDETGKPDNEMSQAMGPYHSAHREAEGEMGIAGDSGAQDGIKVMWGGEYGKGRVCAQLPFTLCGQHSLRLSMCSPH